MSSRTEPTTDQPGPARGAADQPADVIDVIDVARVASGLLATLPDAVAAVRRAAFTRLRADRVPATVADLAADTRLDVGDVRDGLDVLVDTGSATLDQDGAVTAVGGLSVLSTAHQMLLAGGPPVGGPVVGWLPGQTCTNVQADFCPQANLFCDDGHLAAWRAAAGNPPGRGATLAELADLGAQVWAEMAAPAGSHESPRPTREGESS